MHALIAAMWWGISMNQLDATVSTSDGRAVALSSRYGKPTVLFYEDRYSTELNAALKAELFERGKKDGVLNAVTVVAVANLQGWNWFPARDFAMAAVREAERKSGIDIYIDWVGSLTTRPFLMRGNTSTVLVIDATGKEIFRGEGALDVAERERIFTVLKVLLS